MTIHVARGTKLYIDDYAHAPTERPPLTPPEKRAAYMNLGRRTRSDLLNRSALTMVAGG